MKIKELGELLDILRQKGVTDFSSNEDGASIMVKLGPTDSPSSVVETPKAAVQKAFKEMMEPGNAKPTGPDGLTKEQQEEIYGQPVDIFPE